MKKTNDLLALLVLLLISISAKAQALNIIHTIPSPAGLSLDLAFDGQDLWVGNGYTDSLVYKISTIDGNVLKTLTKDPNLSPAGLTFANGYLYMTDTGPSLIHKVDTTDGTFVETYNAPFDMSGYPSGLTWDGASFWLIEAITGALYQLDTNFEVIQVINGEIGSFGSGLAFINGNLWFTENLTDILYEMDTTDFEIQQQFDITQEIYPNGLAFDGQYLWLAISGENGPGVDSIYQIDIGLPPVVSVNEQDESFKVKIFPNPVDDVLYIDLDLSLTYEEIELTIYDALGKTIRSQNIENQLTSVQVDDLTAGTYFFILKSNVGFTQAGQFVVF